MKALAEVHQIAVSQATQIDVEYEREFSVLWGYMQPHGRPTFNSALLQEARAFGDAIERDGGLSWSGILKEPVNYVIAASRVPGVFNLGGDLALFREAIRNQDRLALIDYADACIDNVYRWHTCFNRPLTTISLVQGEALGGGFESALSASVLIAEETARFGFPEILFNLFPGMGAYSLLSRKVGTRVADQVITSGIVYSASDMFKMGIVDIVTPAGAGKAGVYEFIRKHAKSGNARRALESVARQSNPLTKAELSRVVNIWVDAALRLSERDLRMMDRLVRAQDKSGITLSAVPSLQSVA
jgi:DSF synthase